MEGGREKKLSQEIENLSASRSPRPPVPPSPSPPVLILGGGFAGLAAAVDLAEAGRRGLLLEPRSFLGGRAHSFTDKITGDTGDKCQHFIIGRYHPTLSCFGKIGFQSVGTPP